MVASLTRTAPTLQEAVILLHIPKTAGRTLHHIIARRFPKDAVYDTFGFDRTSRGRSRIAELKELPEEDRARIRYVRLHPGPFGLHEYFPQPCSYVTLLRDPVDRLLSSYFFILRSPYLHNYIRDEATSECMTLEDFARSRTNVQIRMVSGVAGDSLTYSGTLPSDVMAISKRNIQEHFAFVGLVESFDESLALLNRAFGWTNTLYTRENVAKKRPRKEDIPKDTLRLIESCNEVDIELYEWARHEFERLIREQGPSFNSEVQRFRSRNKVYQRINRPLSMMGRFLRYGMSKVR